VRGQVRSVNGRAREIQLQSNNGRNIRLEYDSRTQVVFQNRRYSASNLERGDYVRARVQRGNRGAYADRIVVERSARDTRGRNDNRDVYRDNDRGNSRDRQRFDGRVARIDYNRGYFQLQQSRGPNYTVVMPYRPRNADLKHFRSLRNGQRVRFDGTFLSRDRIELQRFR
jgi:cold shock CspA family protein